MKLYGQIGIFCERCGERKEVYFNAEFDTVTSIKQRATEVARKNGWTVTRLNKCYCQDCAKKLRLRNSGISKK